MPWNIFCYDYDQYNNYKVVSRYSEVLKLMKKHNFNVYWVLLCYGAAKNSNKEIALRIISNFGKHSEFGSNVRSEAVLKHDLKTLK